MKLNEDQIKKLRLELFATGILSKNGVEDVIRIMTDLLAQSEGEIPEWCCGINETCGCHCHKKRGVKECHCEYYRNNAMCMTWYCPIHGNQKNVLVSWHCKKHSRAGVTGTCTDCEEEKGYRDSTREPALKFEAVPERLNIGFKGMGPRDLPTTSAVKIVEDKINEILDYLAP